MFTTQNSVSQKQVVLYLKEIFLGLLSFDSSFSSVLFSESGFVNKLPAPSVLLAWGTLSESNNKREKSSYKPHPL